MGDQESQKGIEMAMSSAEATEDESHSPPSTALAEAGERGSGYENAEPSFDVGLKAWLQVLGAFFLWFNSWSVCADSYRSTYRTIDPLANSQAKGHHQYFRGIPDLLRKANSATRVPVFDRLDRIHRGFPPHVFRRRYRTAL